jgi:hypothetical protein
MIYATESTNYVLFPMLSLNGHIGYPGKQRPNWVPEQPIFCMWPPL